MSYSQNPILSSLCLHVYKRASGSLTQVVDECTHNCFPYTYKFRVIFNRNISYQSKQHLLFMPNNLKSSTADKEVNLFKLLNEFLHFVLLESCITNVPLTDLHTVLFFFSQHCPRAINLLKRLHFLVPSDICPTQFPISLLYFSLHFCYFLMKTSEGFFFYNVKVLFHVKDHQSSQVSLLLKIGTNWCSGRVVM